MRLCVAYRLMKCYFMKCNRFFYRKENYFVFNGKVVKRRIHEHSRGSANTFSTCLTRCVFIYLIDECNIFDSNISKTRSVRLPV